MKLLPLIPFRAVSPLRTLSVAAGLFVLAISGSASAQVSNDPDALLDRLRAKYESLTAIRATFEQTTSSPVFDSDDRISGTLTLSGERYRLEAGMRTMVTDGVTIWIYDRSASQVIVGDYEEDESTFSVTQFLYRFDERYRFDSADTATEGGETVHRVRMVPIDPADFFRSVTVTMRDRDAIVTRVTVIDASEVTMTFTLRDIVENPPVNDRMFAFEAPDGVEIVDLRS